MSTEPDLTETFNALKSGLQAPDASAIASEADRRRGQRRTTSIAALSLVLFIGGFGIFAMLNNSETEVATSTEDDIPTVTDGPGVELVETLTVNGARLTEESFGVWFAANSEPGGAADAASLTAIDDDPTTNGVRLTVTAFPLDDSFEYWVQISGLCGERISHGLLQFGEQAQFLRDQTPTSANIGFAELPARCSPPMPERLDRVLSSNFDIVSTTTGLRFTNGTDQVSFAPYDWEDPPKAETDLYLSLTVDDAADEAEWRAREWRVINIDGEAQEHTEDIRPGRMNFTVVDGLVLNAQTDAQLYRDSSIADEATPTTLESNLPAPSNTEEAQGIQVPSVTGLLIDIAVSDVEAAGLIAEIQYVNEPTGVSEHIIRTDPPVGSKIDVGSTVVLVTQEAMEVPEDPEGIPFIALEILIADNPDIFVGYYVEDGLPAIRTSPSADMLSAGTMVQSIPNLDFAITACTRSSEELAGIVDDLKEFSVQIGLDSATSYGIDAENCSVHFGATLSPAQEDQFEAEFGNSVTIDPDFSLSRRLPTPDE